MSVESYPTDALLENAPDAEVMSGEHHGRQLRPAAQRRTTAEERPPPRHSSHAEHNTDNNRRNGSYLPHRGKAQVAR